MKEKNSNLNLIKDSVRRLYELGQEKKKFDEYYNQVRKKEQLMVSNFMFSNLPKDENSFEITLDEGISFYTNPTKVIVTRIRTKKVFWLVEKLKEKLDKKTYNKIVDKTYTINDMEGLIKYLKSCGVDAKKFKKFIEVNEEVDETKLNNLYDRGEIKKKQIEDCYEVKLGEPYIRITEQKV